MSMCRPTTASSASSQLHQEFKRLRYKSADETRSGYEALLKQQVPTGSPESSSISQWLPACFRNAQLEADENAIREQAGLPGVWRQPLNTRALQTLEQADIRCPVPASILKNLVRGDWLARMGGRVEDYIRQHESRLQVRIAGVQDHLQWVTPTFHLEPSMALVKQGFRSICWYKHESPLWTIPTDTQHPDFPRALQDPNQARSCIGLWSSDSCDGSWLIGPHHGLLVCTKSKANAEPAIQLCGYSSSPGRSSCFYPVDPAAGALAAGRRAASCCLFDVGSLSLLHRIEGLLRKEVFPEGVCEDEAAQQAYCLTKPLWNLPVEKRFPALVHLLITGTRSRAQRLVSALKFVSQRDPQDHPAALDAQSVISLAISATGSAYPLFISGAIHCRFLAKRVMRVAELLLDLRPAPDLEGSLIAGVRIRSAFAHSPCLRLLLWLTDLLSWFVERFYRPEPFSLDLGLTSYRLV